MSGTEPTDLPGGPGQDPDESVSAVLDGVATAEETARVHADPVLSARLAEFRGQRAALLLPTAPSSNRPGSAAVPTGRGPSWRAAAVAAAAAVVAVVLGVAVVTGREDGSDQVASDAGEVVTTTAPAGTAAAERSGTPAPQSGTDGTAAQSERSADAGPGPGTVADLGTFDDLAALTRSAGTDAPPAPAEAAATVPCAERFATDGATVLGTAVVAGAPVAVGRTPDGRVVVRALPGCEPVGGVDGSGPG